jgi:adenosylcobinamide-GDP ribazoletransferase
MVVADAHVEPEIATSTPGRDAIRGIRAAFATLTRIPVGGFPYRDAEWRWSSAHLPFVGACLGVLLAIVWFLVERAGYGVAAIVTTAASLVLTGAMHEDGLADTADALGGGLADRERILRIMKDSRVGTYGAAAIALSLGLRVALLTRLGPLAPVALVLAECASRVVPVSLMVLLPYVTDPTVQRSAVVARAGAAQIVVAIAWVLAFAAPAAWWLRPSPWSGVALVAPVVITSWGSVALFRKSLGGITGDTLGAAQQIAWLALLLAFALLRGGSP